MKNLAVGDHVYRGGRPVTIIGFPSNPGGDRIVRYIEGHVGFHEVTVGDLFTEGLLE